MENLGKKLWESNNTAVGKMISTYLSNKEDLDDITIHFLLNANRWEKRFQKTTILGRSILKLKFGTSVIRLIVIHTLVWHFLLQKDSTLAGVRRLWVTKSRSCSILGHNSRDSSRTWRLWRRAI